LPPIFGSKSLSTSGFAETATEIAPLHLYFYPCLHSHPHLLQFYLQTSPVDSKRLSKIKD